MAELIHGFKLAREQYISELNSEALLYEHVATGARLLFLKNDDDNKVFSITFRTPARDSTGIAHIIEHSVLAGSEKYPLREPFVELVKGSLNTFVNAITFPDKTMYPVASRNDKDFFNLIDVYLDAVFNPSIKHEPNIFKQEGWRYDLDDAEAELQLNGVVYNEMKGAYSSPECVVERKIFETLFPDSSYGIESGGHPDHIPDLKYSQFCKFHDKYYHPSNAWVFVYGDADIKRLMQELDAGYFARYERREVNSAVKTQTPFDEERQSEGCYPVGNDAGLSDKTFLTYSFVTGRSTDTRDMMALKALESILLDSAAAPLRRALIDAGIGQDVCGEFDSVILQPVFTVKAVNANPEDAARFREVVLETLTRLVKDGIDKKLIEAALNRKEFNLREADFGSYPKGLIYNIAVMESWLYDEDPLPALEYERYLPALRAGLQTDYFEKLITKYFLDNQHRVLAVVRPQCGLEEESAAAVRERLQRLKEKMTLEEVRELVADTARLKEWQARPDAESDLLKIPVLERSDLERAAQKLPLEHREIADRPLLLSDVFTNKIVYCNLVYDMRAVHPDDFEYLNLLIAVLGKMGTVDRNYADLINEVNIRTGSFGITSIFYSDYNNPGDFQPKVCVRFKALQNTFEPALDIVREIIGETVFTDKQRFYEIIQELHAESELTLLDDGSSLAAAEMLARLVPSGSYQARSLRPFYQFIRAVDSNYDACYPELAEKLQAIGQALFTRDNLLVHLTCPESDLDAVCPALEAFIAGASAAGETALFDYRQPVVPGNCGLVIPSKVQYVLKGLNFADAGYRYSGSMKVLDTILSYDYLWSKIRILGGAYGAFARFGANGAMYVGSYRDPHLESSVKAYDAIGTYLEEFSISDREMLKYIIGTLSRTDLPLTPAQKGMAALQDYFNGRTFDDLQRERDELLATDQRVIRSYASLFDELKKTSTVCVVGGKEKIEQSRNIFDEIVDVVS